MTGRNCPERAGCNNVEVCECQRLVHFVLVSRSEARYPIDRTMLHIYMNYLMAEKENLAQLLCLKDVAITAYSVVIGHGYLEHGKCDLCGSDCLRNHNFLMPLGTKLETRWRLGAGQVSR